MRAALPLAIALALTAACGSPSGEGEADADGGRQPDAATGTGIDAGPVKVSFTPVLTQAGSNFRNLIRDGETGLYAVNQQGYVLHSTDQGRSWTAPGGMSWAGLTRAPDGTLYSNDSTWGITRSTDGGKSFQKLTLPYPQAAQGYVPVVRAGADGTLLLAHRVEPAVLYVSTDRGDHFTPAAATPEPLTRMIDLPEAADGYLYVFDDRRRVYRTKDGSAWEDLGTFFTYKFLATPAGTLLLEVGTAGVGIEQLRSTDGGKHWDRQAAGAVHTFGQRPNGQLVRTGLGVDVSDDEGKTWTPVVPDRTGTPVYELVAYDDVLVGETLSGLARLPSGATAWEAPMSTTIPGGADLRDLAFDASGRIVVAGKKQIFTSGDGGATWRLGAHVFDDVEPLRAIAVRPDGQRIFVGSTLSRFWFTDGAGDQLVITSDLDRPTEHIEQAQWIGDERSHLLTFTTANADDTSGIVLYSSPTDDHLGWKEINPLRLEAAPGERFTVGYHAIAITEAAPQGGDRSLYVGARQWYGTNAWMNHVLVQLDLLSVFDPWLRGETPLAYTTPMTLSPAGPYGQTLAMLYANDKLFLYSFTGVHTEVTATGVTAGMRSAKFDRAGHLWILTSNGLFRSTQVFGR